MIYVARAYYEDKEMNLNSLRLAQLVRKVADVEEETMGLDITPPRDVGSVVHAQIAFFAYDWYKDEVCKRQLAYCKAHNIPAFFDLQKLEQYISDKSSGELQ